MYTKHIKDKYRTFMIDRERRLLKLSLLGYKSFNIRTAAVHHMIMNSSQF